MAERHQSKEPLRVAVILGGQSAEREISLKTGRTVVGELSRRFRVRPVLILASGAWVPARGYVGEELGSDADAWFRSPEKTLLAALSELTRDGIDVAFNALHGPLGEDGTVQGLFRMVGVPLTGPDVAPAALTMDKRLTKDVLRSGGLSTPRSFALPATRWLGGEEGWLPVARSAADALRFPWIVKPNRLGSSVGVAIFRDLDELRRGAPKLLRSWPSLALRDQVLVEEVVSGRELTCGVVETRPPARALPPVEIRPRTSAFFDYRAKYVPGATEEICPAPLSDAETRRVQETALRVHSLLECEPLSRTDMILTADGRLEVLEVNTLPGMTATSLIPLSASRAGIALAELLAGIVEHAIRRDRAGAESPPAGVQE